MSPRIALTSSSIRQRRLKTRLRAVLRKHNQLRKWQFTDRIRVDGINYSYSYPTLTIGALSSSVGTEIGLMAVYLHEQLHWFVSRYPKRLRLAMADLRAKYPKVKVGRKQGGARDARSTYLHLLVCFLELEVLTKVMGARRARRLALSRKYYRWIYKTVVADYEEIERIASKRGLLA